MPRLDGTGPMGKGPRTGKGQGKCRKGQSPVDEPRPDNGPTITRHTGRDRGKGKRLRRGFRE